MMTVIEDLFLSTGIDGYIAVLVLVIFCAYIMKRDRLLGFFCWIVECLVVYYYSTLLEATPDYYWHFLIVLLGALFTFVYPLWDR